MPRHLSRSHPPICVCVNPPCVPTCTHMYPHVPMRTHAYPLRVPTRTRSPGRRPSLSSPTTETSSIQSQRRPSSSTESASGARPLRKTRAAIRFRRLHVRRGSWLLPQTGRPKQGGWQQADWRVLLSSVLCVVSCFSRYYGGSYDTFLKVRAEQRANQAATARDQARGVPRVVPPGLRAARLLFLRVFTPVAAAAAAG